MSLAARLTGATLAVFAVPAAYAADPATIGETAKGKTLVDAKSMTLYTFAKDTEGKSACVDKCAENWPPLAAQSGAAPMGDWTIVTRPDGAMQWAYKGKALYAFVKDAKPGDAVGDGLMNGAWRVAQP